MILGYWCSVPDYKYYCASLVVVVVMDAKSDAHDVELELTFFLRLEFPHDPHDAEVSVCRKKLWPVHCKPPN